jgi:hypothetical protein
LAPLICKGDGESISFQIKVLTVDANEGCDIADFDGDGKLDVVAGRNWFHNPDWVPRPVRLIEDINGYIHSNGDFAYDVDGDGDRDVVAGDFFNTQVYWYENRGSDAILKGFLWPKHELVDTGLGANEIAFFHDLDGDGKPEWICNSWIDKNPLVAWKLDTETVTKEGQAAAPGKASGSVTLTQPTLRRHLISEVGQSHGFGFGDINNDGREDILTAAGWFEKPEGDVWENPWRYHADWKTRWSCPVIVRDLNADGRNDIIAGAPHDYGLLVWWGEAPSEDGKLEFRENVIDRSYSQLHCLHMADLDGDGRAELITGKRVRAHNANDPGAADPPIICYYTIGTDGKFTRHIINKGQVGIGLQIRTADLDNDGDIDIVVPGKEGTQILFNQRR